MAAQIFPIKQGSTRPVLSVLLIDTAGTALPILNSVIELTIQDEMGNPIVDHQPVNIVDAPTGLVEYEFSALELQNTGIFYGDFEITYTDGSIQHAPEDPEYPFIIIQILPSN